MSRKPGKSDMLTTSQVAELANVDRATVTRWLRLGLLAGIRTPGGQWRVRAQDVERWLRSQGEGPEVAESSD